MNRLVKTIYVILCCLFGLFAGCGRDVPGHSILPMESSEDSLRTDPMTGIPYALTFQYPIQGFEASDFGFGFGSINDHFCLAWNGDECQAFGAHLGRDTQVGKTPVGTAVHAPADGIVRISTGESFGGFGSDSAKNPAYKGCLVLLEHEFPNGQPVLTLLGHVQCEGSVPYDVVAQKGNPSVGAVVRRGQYVGHVAHYWTGQGMGTDWHHLHWAMRIGPYSVSKKTSFVAGYALPSEFSSNVVTHAKEHPVWLDPFQIIAALGDPQAEADIQVRTHPAGSLLQDASGNLFRVVGDGQLSALPPTVATADRYDLTQAVLVTEAELACYSLQNPQGAIGPTLLYKRAGSPTVVIANQATLKRQDFLRWEALLSWGFSNADIKTDLQTSLAADALYLPEVPGRGFRPGSLVKADEAAEVCIVRPDGHRQPIFSAEVFEALGYRWEKVYSVPAAVLDVLAGPRLNVPITWELIHSCPVSSPCPGGGPCGGGSDPCAVLGCVPPSTCQIMNDGSALCLEDPSPVCMGECVAGVSENCVACPGVMGVRTCSTQTCTWSACSKPSVPEICSDGIDNDCNGAMDCQDPSCAAQASCLPVGMGSHFPLRLSYAGEVFPGSITLNAWWQPPANAPRPWGPVMECMDTIPGDGVLECVFNLPHGTTSFEFQLDLPNGGYWGDTSCYPKGGCGKTNGTVSLQDAQSSQPLAYELLPNVPGEPYLKGRVGLIP